MLSPQKISAFRVAYKKKQSPITASYLKIHKLDLNTIEQPRQIPMNTIDNEKSWLCQNQSHVFEGRVHVRERKNFQSPKFYKKQADYRSKSLSTDSRNKYQLKKIVRNLLEESKNTSVDEPIHSRKTQRFKILAGTLKKNRSHTCQTIQNTKFCNDAIKIKRETIHDFNDYSLKYIHNLQKQAARVVKTAERQTHRNHINYTATQTKRKRKLQQITPEGQKIQLCRPWSRQKNPDSQQQQTGIYFF